MSLAPFDDVPGVRALNDTRHTSVAGAQALLLVALGLPQAAFKNTFGVVVPQFELFKVYN